ncbi:MAG: hypothetical protein M3277_07585 [Actinomycetota bacterium]|nr:hypothetical protein [Actinomycetota bacterium]
MLGTALIYGFRHGFDWDHIAAITDITSSQDDSRRAMILATLYAVGHAAVVFMLGVTAIVAGDFIPAGIDEAMGRIVGITLIALGVYVFYSLLRHGRNFRMRSRWMIVIAGARRLIRRLQRQGAGEPVTIEHAHEHVVGNHGHHHHHDEVAAGSGSARVITVTHNHTHRHIGVLPDDPFMNYGATTATGIGMIHGVGAETPTQVLLLLAAVGVGGGAAGIAVLVAFLVGLFASNSLVAAASTFGYLNATKSFVVYAAIAVLTGLFSLALGLVLLLAKDAVLPRLFGG